MSINLRHLRAFLAVAHLASFTRAADRLSITQPALTMCIRQLEELIGVALFNRTTRRVSLTAAGEDFLPTAERLIHDFEVAIHDVKAIADRQQGRVSVAAIPSVAVGWLPTVVSRFVREFPGISIHLQDDSSYGVRRRVRRGDVDFGFTGLWELDAELDYTPVLRDKVGLVCRIDHPLALSSGTRRWIDLAGHTFLNMGHAERIRSVLEQVPELAATMNSTKYRIANTATLVAMLEAGLGITALPATAIPKSARALLAFVPLTEPALDRTICVIQRKDHTLLPAARALLEAILNFVITIERPGEVLAGTIDGALRVGAGRQANRAADRAIAAPAEK